jgi:hypothetical protein
MRSALGAVVLAALAVAGPASAQTNPRLEWFKPLAGKTWKCTFPGGAVDVHRFEFILGGQVLRTIHSVNDGAYGGAAVVYWDAEKETLASHYVTTAGFFTTATMRIEDGAMLSHEIVHGGPAGGVDEVKAESRILPDGRLLVKSRQLKGGEWTPGAERYYSEDPKAEVVFKP